MPESQNKHFANFFYYSHQYRVVTNVVAKCTVPFHFISVLEYCIPYSIFTLVSLQAILCVAPVGVFKMYILYIWPVGMDRAVSGVCVVCIIFGYD